VPVPCDLQRANIHRIALYVLLTLVEHSLLRGHLPMIYHGFACAFYIETDDLGGSPVVPLRRADSGFYHELDVVRIAHEAGGVPLDLLGGGLDLGVELLGGLPLDAYCLSPR
jgi:hypothetical protein